MQNKNTPTEGQNSDKLEAESALRDAACSPFGPLRIVVSGNYGPSGKTRAQLIIAKALRDAGYSVTCQDTACGVSAKHWQRRVGRFHGDAGKTYPCEVLIDVENDKGLAPPETAHKSMKLQPNIEAGNNRQNNGQPGGCPGASCYASSVINVSPVASAQYGSRGQDNIALWQWSVQVGSRFQRGTASNEQLAWLRAREAEETLKRSAS